MRRLKQVLSFMLVLALTVQCSGLTAYAEGLDSGAPRAGAVLELEEGVTYRDNGDGTATIQVYQVPEGRSSAFAQAASAPGLSDTGDAYTSTEGPVYLELAKSFEPGEQIAAVSSTATGISFYPEPTQPEETAPSLDESPMMDTAADDEEETPADIDNVNDGDAFTEAPEEPALSLPPEELAVEESAEDAPAEQAALEEAVPPADNEIPRVESQLPFSDPAADAGEDEALFANEGQDETKKTEEPEQTQEPEGLTRTLRRALRAATAPEPEESSLEDDPPARAEEAAPEPEEPAAPEPVEAVAQASADGTVSAVYYPSVFHEDADILLEPTATGVKESIVLNEYTTDTYSYTLQLDGMTPELFENEIFLRDAEQNICAVLTAPYMIDAAGNESKNIEVGLSPLGANRYRLTYELDKAWLLNAQYPVTVDPTVEYEFNYENYKFIEDTFVAETYPDTNESVFGYHDEPGNQGITVGAYKWKEARGYFRMAFPDSVIAEMDNGLIKELKLHVYNRFGGGTFTAYQVIGGAWDYKTITWNNAPGYLPEALDRVTVPSRSLENGCWTEWDLTKAASRWFNALEQWGNFGICIVADDYLESSVCFASSRHGRNYYGAPAYYSITYYKDPADPNLEVTAAGNGINSGTGYADLSWEAVEGADGYYVGVFDGKDYEYFYVGDTTSWTTKDRGLWPTEAEIESGRYLLHGDGAGAELPMLPALSYANAGGSHAGDLNYYFTVIPANRYGQAPNPAHYATKQLRLPDTIPPSVAETVSIEPSAYTNAESVRLSWAGIRDYNTSETAATASMGETGKIQYALDSGSDWNDTGSSTGDGSLTLDVASLADGKHTVSVRGVDSAGNVGAVKYAEFYLDRTPPTAPKLTLTPADWSSLDSAALSWSGIADINPLSRVEYSIDGGAYVSTGRSEEACSDYMLALDSLTDGEHSLRLRAVDAAGNAGAAASAVIKRDTAAPELAGLMLTPASWSSSGQRLLHWDSLRDAHSGLQSVWYRLDAGEQQALAAETEATHTMDVAALADGIHTLTLHVEDRAGNAKEETLRFWKDTTPPELQLLEPLDGSLVNGTVEVRGSVHDRSLKSWELVAIDEQGAETLLRSGEQEMDAERLAVFNSTTYDDGARITLLLRAQDEAGHKQTLSGTVVTVDKSARSVPGEVHVTAPEKNAVITEASVKGSYTLDGTEKEKKGLLYVDGEFCAETKNGAFPFEAIRYAEGSGHSLSVLSLSPEGELRYSDGLSAVMLDSALFEDGTKQTQSEALRPDYAILALRLRVSERVLDGGETHYWYSTDGGTSWTELLPDQDTPLLERPESLQIKGEATGDAELLGWTLEGIVETSPHTVSVRLLRPVEELSLEEQTVRSALTELAEEPENTQTAVLFQDGAKLAESFRYDARVQDGGSVALVALLKDGRLLGSGAEASVLLREAPEATGTRVSQALRGNGKLYALRLEAVSEGSGKYFYSTDGKDWKRLTPGAYLVLEQAAETVYVKAELGSGKLLAWHVEGVSCTESRIDAELIKAPVQVTCTDWGEYYANRNNWHYDLRWEDPSPEDATAPNQTSYEIYRNGTLIATVPACSFTDPEYLANAQYEVQTVRSYGSDYEPKKSGKVPATVTVMQPPRQQAVGVSYTPTEEKQSSYLDKLYGGNYSFGTTATAPEKERQLKAALLGRNQYCAYGFEPVNFNTGNFLLETEDQQLAGLGEATLRLDRSYNAQSEAKDGPFGAKWASPWTEHLRLYDSGEIVYVAENGAETVFTAQRDGSYIGGEAQGLTLSRDAASSVYYVKASDGKLHAFNGVGLLRYIEWADGSRIAVERDGDGLLTGFVLPGGEVLRVESDKNGHITAIAVPGGGELRYEYSGRNLVKFTDASEAETRYRYDSRGRMTEWTDAEGQRQVKNSYDDQDRVIRQLDANGGEYSLAYFDDHTVMTDAEGNVSEVWFDAQGHTTKTVDATGAATAYSYDALGHIVSMTDALGNVTRYEYDARGNKTRETAPDGSSYSLEYDENNKLTKLTDQLGHVTDYRYDAKRRLIRQTNPDGGELAYTYNAAGEVQTVTDPLGNVTAYTYDGADLVKSTDPNGNTTQYSYDAKHRLTATTDAEGNVTRFAYDGQDNLVSVSFADGSSFAYEYDRLGNLLSETDALGNVTRYEYDPMGKCVKTTYPDGSEASNTYNRNGKLTESVDALGNVTAYAYDGRGKLLTVTDAAGNATRSSYDAKGQLTSQTLATGAETQYVYTPTGLLASMTNAAGETTQYAYDEAGRTVRVTGPDKGETQYAYDALGRLVSQTDPTGAVTSYTYDLAGRLTESTDALGNKTSYTYDKNGNLLSITDALGGVTAYAYDALNRVVSMTDANGATTSYRYDSVGNLVSQTDALGNETRYAYDANGSITGLTDALGGKRAMNYDELGNVVSVLQANGGKVGASYNALGNLLSETDANGATTSYEYDALGRVTTITDALGQRAEIGYDALGQVTRIGAPDGSSTSYRYDTAGRLAEETNAAGLTTRYGYDAAGRLVKTSVNGKETRFAYDLAGNIVAVTDAEGRSITLGYDALGNLLEIGYPDGTKDTYAYDALSRLVTYTPRLGDATEYTYDAMGDVLSVTVGGQTTSYEYDALGRVTATITADGARTEASYDALGNTVRTVDALGNETHYAYTVDSLLREIRLASGAKLTADYDLVGNLLHETDPEGNATAYEYDPVGRMTAVTDALGATTRYEYDAADRLEKVTDALGHETRYSYDATGQLASETDALGNTVSYTYTPEGWLETVTDAEGQVTRYTYDRTGNILTADYAGEQTESNSYNELGLLTTVTTAEGETLYQYDQASRLISVTQPNGETVRYTYDSHGNRLSMTYPNGKTATYSYDEMNRLVSVKGVDGATTKYAYDALGRRIATDGAKEDTSYSYDEVGNLISQTTTGAYDLALEYAYDLSGRMTNERRTENGATLESAYTYDPLGQLTSFTRSDGQSESYVYDPVGNMTAKTKNGVKTAMRYNAANQLTQSITGVEKTTYRYDANGNLVKSENAGGARSYTYNALGLLAKFTREDGYTEDYTYNANRLLNTITTSDNLTTSLSWDVLYGDGVVISSTKNGEQTTYTYGLERISAQNGKTRTEYVYDGRGSVAAEVSYNNAWYTFGGGLAKKDVTTKSYTPFGEQIGEATSGFGYNGEYYNAATGMIYLRARFYAPEMNRFSQKDILRGSAFVPQSLNRYLYVQNDPINFVDSSGESLKTLRDSARSLVRNVAVTATAAVAVAKNTVNQVVKQTVATVSNARTAVSASISTAKSNVIRTAAKSIRAGNGVATTVNNVITSVKNEVQTVKNGVSAAKACIVTGAKSAKSTVEAGIAIEKKIAQTMLPQIADSGAHLLNQLGLVSANGLLKYEDTLNWQQIGALIEFANNWISLPGPIVESLPSQAIIDGNFRYNQEIDIQNQVINNQNTGPVGNLYIGYPGTKGLIGENYPKAIDTGCGIIAVNNIMRFLGMDSSMAQLIRQFQEMDAITTAPVVAKYGEIGSNPYSYPDVLSANGISATKVETIDKMSEKGVYLFTFWNSSQGTNNQASVINGSHTVAATFDGQIYTVYNQYGDGNEMKYSIEDFKAQFEDGFTVGYRVSSEGR